MNGWLRRHEPTRQEIAGLLSIVDRDLRDATEQGISADWRFGIAYNAALKLCSVLLHASGYRPERLLHHYRTLRSMPLILGGARGDDADYLDACRSKRNTVEYDLAGAATPRDAAELQSFAKDIRRDVLAWLTANHPNLL